MARMKSALEIALERTESVKSDKGSIETFEIKQKGKKLANEFLSGSKISLEDEIQKESGETQKNLKQGIYDVLITQITLPAVKDDIKRIEDAGQGLNIIIGKNRFGEVVSQLSQLMNQYMDEFAQYDEAIKRQYAPKLQRKEEELSRRMGRQVNIDPFQDPEFVGFYNQHINTLKGNYEAAITQIKEEASRLFE